MSKILWMVIAPSSLLLIALCVGGVLVWTRRRRLGAWIVTAAAVASLVIAVTPLPGELFVALEDRFPVPTLPERVDGIVVLAGMVDLAVSEARGQVALKGAIERVTVGADLAHRYPDAKLVFTGGSGDIYRPDLSESRYIRPIFEQLGLGGERVTYEGQSRNTFQNAQFTADLVHPQPGEVWVVVTSAFHMPRTMGCFRSIGWDVIPYPVDHRSTGRADLWPPSLDLSGGLRVLDFAAHEYVGLLAYWLTDRSDALFPGPNG